MKKLIVVAVVVVLMMGRSRGEDGGIATIPLIFIIPNTAISAFNIYQINQCKCNYKIIPITGIFTGSLQTLVGASLYHTSIKYTDTSLKRNSYICIGVGSITLISSVWNLFFNHKPKDKALSWNLYSFPTHDKTMGMGCSFSYRF